MIGPPSRTSRADSRGFHVTLIRPPTISVADSISLTSPTPSLALAYLSAVLRERGFSVTNIDALGEALHKSYRLKRNPSMAAFGLTMDEVVARIPAHTHLIGLSCMFSPQWPATRDLIHEIRKAFPKTPIVIGGEHATALPEFSMNDCPAIDYVVLGEGEQILESLANALCGEGEVSRIPGLFYRVAGKPTRAVPGPGPRSFDGASGARVKDVDSLPWPAWDITPLLPFVDGGMQSGRYMGRTMPILGSRGCPYECTFCSNAQMWGRRWASRSPKDVVAEILHYKKTYGIDAFEFQDLTVIIKKQWTLEFCEELIRTQAGIRWQIPGGTRCEAIDEEVIVKLKEAGCDYLGFAPESGVQEVLTRIKKKLKLEHMLKLIRISHRHGLTTRCNLVIGFPEDTRRQIWGTLLFQFRLAVMGVADAPLFEFFPYPGSALFEQLRRDGTIPTLDDGYFETLGNSLQGTQHRRVYCKAVGRRELLFYRVFGMSVFYGVSFLRKPLYLWSLVRNLISFRKTKETKSVFEHRIVMQYRRLRGLTGIS